MSAGRHSASSRVESRRRLIWTLASILAVLFPCGVAARDSPTRDSRASITGHWEGELVRQGARLPVSFDFSRGPTGVAGTFTSLTQRAMEYPLDKVAIAGRTVHFTLGEGSLAFDGRLEGESLAGKLREEDAPGEFALRRVRPSPQPYDREDVTFRNGDATLSGSLFIPRTKGAHPAIVFLHGSGPEIRWGTSRFYADQFARVGIAALIYDKRGAGTSTGDWRRSTFEDLADDAIAAIRLLQRREDIDSRRIGLYGHSQGGLIAPLAASRAPDAVAFLVAAASFPDSVWQQDIYRVGQSIRKQNFSEDEVARAMGVYRLFIDVARGVRSWDELEAASTPVRNERWYKWLGIPPREHWLWTYYRGTGNFQALPAWERIGVPVLLMYGERDQLVPVGESIRKIEGALHRAGNQAYAAIIIPRAAHNLTVTPEPGEPFDWWRAAPGVTNLLTAWVLHQTRAAQSQQ